MDRNAFILQRCQFDKCEATILIKGPYCTKHTHHTHTKHLPELATTGVPSSTLGCRQLNNARLSQQVPSQSHCRSPTMAPREEKLGDAITVKTSHAPAKPPSDKKQLSAKGVARKTTGPISSKLNFGLPRDSNPAAEIAGLTPKKRRLPTHVEKEQGSRAPGRVPGFPTRDVESTAASDFALRPKKENSASLEMPPRHKTCDNQDNPVLKSSYRDPPRKQQVLYNSPKTVIDLTGDDDILPQSSRNGFRPLGLNHKGRSTEVKPPGQINTHGQNEPSYIHDISSNSVSRTLPKKPNEAAAPRPTAQGNPQHSRPPPQSSVDVPRESSVVAERQATIPDSTPLSNTEAINGTNKESRPLSRGQTSAQKRYGAPLESSKMKAQIIPHKSQAINADSLDNSVRLASPKAPTTIHEQPGERESSSSMPNIPPRPETTTQYFNLPKARPTPPATYANQNMGPEQSTSIAATTPNLTLATPKENQTRKTLEEQRQDLIAKHDPKKFDSYIYSKQNEPFRPGSALFGVPQHHLPPRPTRPATTFAHIDPRVHWNHRRPAKWYLEKQRDIRERGTRKSNFARTAACAARRKREAGGEAPRMGLPERVRSNPQWLAALDVLEEMEGKAEERRRATMRKGRQDNGGEAGGEGRVNGGGSTAYRGEDEYEDEYEDENEDDEADFYYESDISMSPV
ncbi:hypothetical protein F5Y04DRAFT_32253 [Hypomontagnella monticulosa]|nr:hypothetical protein F5Y04DRAFT_32253 [Hypomontagnella monticulosa]